MTDPILPRFIQIHSLSGYPGVLLNRDDTGLAKRLPFGPAIRTRMSSQCLKRHWRGRDEEANHHPKSLEILAGTHSAGSDRTKLAIDRIVFAGLDQKDPAVNAVQEEFYKKLYGKDGKDPKKRQALLLGHAETAYLASKVTELVKQTKEAFSKIEQDAEKSEEIKSEEIEKKKKAAVTKKIESELKPKAGLLSQLKEQNKLSAGLTAALFGRMVTSDPAANTDAAIHVAHAFTVHGEQAELDYFTVVDDLKTDQDDAGSAGLFDTELTSGLFYGYVVIDVPLLVSNLTGCARKDWNNTDVDRSLAGQVVENLIHLIAEVSPGAKKGSTAPYSRAELMLVEAGDGQPRTLANAFREPVSLTDRANTPLVTRAADALAKEISEIDAMYDSREMRQLSARPSAMVKDIDGGKLPDVAAWAKARIDEAQ